MERYTIKKTQEGAWAVESGDGQRVAVYPSYNTARAVSRKLNGHARAWVYLRFSNAVRVEVLAYAPRDYDKDRWECRIVYVPPRTPYKVGETLSVTGRDLYDTRRFRRADTLFTGRTWRDVCAALISPEDKEALALWLTPYGVGR